MGGEREDEPHARTADAARALSDASGRGEKKHTISVRISCTLSHVTLACVLYARLRLLSRRGSRRVDLGDRRELTGLRDSLAPPPAARAPLALRLLSQRRLGLHAVRLSMARERGLYLGYELWVGLHLRDESRKPGLGCSSHQVVISWRGQVRRVAVIGMPKDAPSGHQCDLRRV